MMSSIPVVVVVVGAAALATDVSTASVMIEVASVAVPCPANV